MDEFIPLLKDKDNMVRGYAINHLGDLGDPRAADAVMELYPDNPWSVVTALGDMHASTPKAIAVLIDGLSNMQPILVNAGDTSRVRLAASEALVKIGPAALEQMVAVLDDHAKDYVLDEAFIYMGQPAAEVLIATLTHTNFDFKIRAAEILSKMKLAGVYEALCKTSQNEQNDYFRSYFQQRADELADSMKIKR